MQTAQPDTSECGQAMRLPADWQGFNAAACELVDESIERAQDSQGRDVFADWQE
ncbi:MULTISPECIES: hypothetical protein [unclassified Eikenella]|uniref:hypothetical protein n=1 Tax=unclassified Eikenella TaxID=2639367 RepID=UPI000AF250FF|nr:MULTISPECIES: hypothetical protein [unclassified Eikenella]